jgi:hypothetical protein
VNGAFHCRSGEKKRARQLLRCLGIGLSMSSGVPLTALAANPNYTNGGEIPLTPQT